MFFDASAICGILADEIDAAQLSSRMALHSRRITSAVALWEASVALSRIQKDVPQMALRMVGEFLAAQSVAILPVQPEAADLAIDAYARFGKGRHPAAPNFGDCFAYACARHYGVPLLYKGDNFALTDVERA